MGQPVSSDLVSIIMPCYNSSSYVAAAIDSVIAQAYTAWELIIIDDASEDNTNEVLQRFSGWKNIYIIRNERNLGVSESRNRGIEEAKGRYIAFLDSDDLWHPEKLQKQISQMRKTGLSACCSYYDLIDEHSRKKGVREVSTPFVSYSTNLKFNQIGNLTGIYDCKKIGKVFQVDIGHEDYLMWMTILKLTDCDVVHESLASYRLCGGVSSNKIKAAIWHSKILYQYLNLRFHKYLFFMATYVLNGVFRR